MQNEEPSTPESEEEKKDLLRVLEATLKEGGPFGMIETLELRDAILALKRELGYITPPEPGEDCISCSG